MAARAVCVAGQRSVPRSRLSAPPEAPVLAALAELLDGVLACEDAPFDMLTDLAAHGPEDGSRVADELPAFHAALHASHFVTMLRIGPGASAV